MSQEYALEPWHYNSDIRNYLKISLVPLDRHLLIMSWLKLGNSTSMSIDKCAIILVIKRLMHRCKMLLQMDKLRIIVVQYLVPVMRRFLCCIAVLLLLGLGLDFFALFLLEFFLHVL